MRRALITLTLLSTIATCRPAGPTAEERNARITREIDRLEATLKAAAAAGLPDDVKELVAAQQQSLDLVRKASAPDYRLYRLRDPFVGIETLSYLATHKEAAQSLEKFRELWLAERSRFEAKVPEPQGTLLQRALVESAATRADRLFRASLPYAKVSAVWSGVYYLGEAEGNARFRDFVLKTGAAERSSEAGPARDRIASALDALERDTLKYFAGDVTNQKLIAVSVRLKEANELLDAKRIDGAMLLLLEARLALSRRGGPPGSYPAEARAGEGSVPALLTAWADSEEPAMKELFRTQVTPFFASLLLPATGATKPPAQVTVTLVRWPYT